MPAGVPTFGKFGAKRQKAYLDSLAAGNSKMTAAEQSAVSYDLIRRYRKVHPEFIDRETEAELRANGLVVDALHEQARTGNVKAIEFWLCNRDPDNWKKQRTVHLDLGRLDSDIDGLLAQLAARGQAALAPEAGGSPASPTGLNGTAGHDGGNGKMPH